MTFTISQSQKKKINTRLTADFTGSELRTKVYQRVPIIKRKGPDYYGSVAQKSNLYSFGISRLTKIINIKLD